MPETEPAWLSPEEEVKLKTFLGWLLCAIALGLAVSFVTSLWSQSFQARRQLILLLPSAVVGLSAWALRTNVRRSGVILVVGIWVFAAINSLLLAGVYASGNVIFPFVIMLAGWMFGKRWLVALTLATVFFLMGMAVFEVLGWFEPAGRAPPIQTVVTYLVVIPVVAYLTWSMRNILLKGRVQTQQLLKIQEEKSRALQRSEADMQALMENMPAAVASFDMESRLVRCNGRYAALFASEPDALLRRQVSEYVPKVVLDQIQKNWDLALAGQPQKYRRFNVNPLTSELTWVDSGLVPAFRDGVQIGMDAVLIDVTDRVQADAQIRSLNAELERRVERRTTELSQARSALQESHDELVRSQAKAGLSAMVASVSHELGTPIGNSTLIATTFTDLARKLQADLAQGALRKSELIALSNTWTEGSQQLVTNLGRAETLLRSFRQVSADQASEQRRKFDLRAVVAEVVSSMGPSLNRTPHRVVTDIPSGITMDSLPGPLGQAIINLINNALIHGFEGVESGVVDIVAQADGERVVITVKDNGKGMSADVLEHLLEPFFSTRIGEGGTGLGMSIVDSIVTKTLGGQMRVQSHPGSGSTFEIDLPLNAPEHKL